MDTNALVSMQLSSPLKLLFFGNVIMIENLQTLFSMMVNSYGNLKGQGLMTVQCHKIVFVFLLSFRKTSVLNFPLSSSYLYLSDVIK